MKAILLAALGSLTAPAILAQPVPKAVVVEHFTNTYCSVCASRNPGFYAALQQKPEVLHIAFHPSSPYPACPLSQHNVSENDARANYYYVYGGTPRLVVNGVEIQPNADYADTAIYSPYLGLTSPFEFRTSFRLDTDTTAVARVAIYKRASTSMTTISVFGFVVEDTIAFAAANGEAMHYDVFRKLTNQSGQTPVSQLAIGDSIVRTFTVPIHNAWNIAQLSLVVIANAPGSHDVVQASRAALMDNALGIKEEVSTTSGLVLTPNPASDFVIVSGLEGRNAPVIITDVAGRVMQHLTSSSATLEVQVRDWAPGLYFVRIVSGGARRTLRFVKQ